MPGALLISIQLGLWLAAATSIVGAQQGYMVPSAGGGSSLTVRRSHIALLEGSQLKSWYRRL